MVRDDVSGRLQRAASHAARLPFLLEAQSLHGRHHTAHPLLVCPVIVREAARTRRILLQSLFDRHAEDGGQRDPLDIADHTINFSLVVRERKFYGVGHGQIAVPACSTPFAVRLA